MTIAEAAKKWGVSEKTIGGYLVKGYINNLSINNNEIIIPDIPKPKINKKAKGAKNIYKEILRVCCNGMYTNAKILNIDNQTFIAYLDNLEKKELICKKSNEKNDASTLNYIATVKGTNLYKDKKFDKLIGGIFNFNFSLINAANP